MRIGVVIVTYNGIDYTRACLQSVAGLQATDLVTIVVDNASSDGTPDTVAREFPNVVLLAQGDNLGFTGGNNVGIRWCLEHGVDAVLLLNNDATVAPDLVERMLPYLEPAGIVVPHIQPVVWRGPVDDGIAWFDWRRGVARPISRPIPAFRGRLPTRVASGCCLLIARAVFERVGLFDENFYLYFEDVDFLVRAQLQGFRVAHEPAAIVRHYGSASSGGRIISPLTLYYNNRNRIYLMRKHSCAGIAFIGYFTATRLLYAASYLLAGEWTLLRSMWRGVLDGIRGRLSRQPAF